MRYRISRIALLLTASLFLASSSAMPAEKGSVDGDIQEIINYLVEFVRSSDVVFIRNDKEHTPEEAVSHMLKKYKYAKRKVKTPEDFIEYCATKSTVSGKPYLVRLVDGRTITSAQWLLAALEDYRSEVAGKKLRGMRGEAAGSIEYETREFRKQYGSCPTPQEDCASVVIHYPEFTGVDVNTGLAAIAGEIRRRLTAPVYEGTEPRTLAELAGTFIEGYRKTQADFPDYRQGWTLEREASVAYADDSLVCVAFRQMSFTGGAHPNSKTEYSNYRRSDGSEIELADILVAGYGQELTAAAEKAFREVRVIDEGESLEDAGFWFEDGVFSLNENFGITEGGLVFYFDYYEVAPYSMGPAEIIIPYGEISSLIRDEGLLEGVFK